MGFSKTKKVYLLWLTLIYIIVGGGIHLILQLFFPEHLFRFYSLVPLFFYLFGWYYIYAYELCRKYKPNRMMSLYVGMKFVKMLFSVIILLVYVKGLHVDKHDFFIPFFIFFFVSIFYETYFFYHEYLKHLKDKKE